MMYDPYAKTRNASSVQAVGNIGQSIKGATGNVNQILGNQIQEESKIKLQEQAKIEAEKLLSENKGLYDNILNTFSQTLDESLSSIDPSKRSSIVNEFKSIYSNNSGLTSQQYFDKIKALQTAYKDVSTMHKIANDPKISEALQSNKPEMLYQTLRANGVSEKDIADNKLFSFLLEGTKQKGAQELEGIKHQNVLNVEEMKQKGAMNLEGAKQKGAKDIENIKATNSLKSKGSGGSSVQNLEKITTLANSILSHKKDTEAYTENQKNRIDKINGEINKLTRVVSGATTGSGIGRYKPEDEAKAKEVIEKLRVELDKLNNEQPKEHENIGKLQKALDMLLQQIEIKSSDNQMDEPTLESPSTNDSPLYSPTKTIEDDEESRLGLDRYTTEEHTVSQRINPEKFKTVKDEISKRLYAIEQGAVQPKKQEDVTILRELSKYLKAVEQDENAEVPESIQMMLKRMGVFQ